MYSLESSTHPFLWGPPTQSSPFATPLSAGLGDVHHGRKAGKHVERGGVHVDERGGVHVDERGGVHVDERGGVHMWTRGGVCMIDERRCVHMWT